MAVRTREELLEAVKNAIGDDTSDSAISLIEDLTDTLDNGGQDWQKKYQENDAAWRKKYRDRFFGKASDEDKEEDGEPEAEKEKPLKYEDLFKEGDK